MTFRSYCRPTHCWTNADRIRLAATAGPTFSTMRRSTLTKAGTSPLSVAQLQDRIVVSVRDTGIGMDDEALGNVFELFAQAAGTVHARPGRTGCWIEPGAQHRRNCIGRRPSRAVQRRPWQGQRIRASVTGGCGTTIAGKTPAAPAGEPRVPTAASWSSMTTSMPPKVSVRCSPTPDTDVRVAHGGVGKLLSAAREIRTECDDPRPRHGRRWTATRSPARYGRPAIRRDRGSLPCPVYGQPDDRRRTADVGFDEHLVKPVEHDVLNAALG